MIKPLFGAQDDEWVTMVGRYLLNMGAIEMATRSIIVKVTGSDSAPIFSDNLAARIGFVRKHYPREDKDKHSAAMVTFEVALKLTTFRNIVAHSPIAVTEAKDGTFTILGILGLTPTSIENVGELISLEELKGRVNESSAIARRLLDMQPDYVRVLPS
ncbi:hypothetical protein C7H79_02335 [Nitrosomonas supralitoralis]|uniref:Uncharacterized protein n=2 Tax=Nitrosomonas supralitoralis TaxID=2116706 RepID=A0A2P7NYB3_9PROT|nr:hypothetical protein C7H79_02335 [Nitrosomonas supralitoralis]